MRVGELSTEPLAPRQLGLREERTWQALGEGRDSQGVENIPQDSPGEVRF